LRPLGSRRKDTGRKANHEGGAPGGLAAPGFPAALVALVLAVAGALLGAQPVAAAGTPFDGWTFNGVGLTGSEAKLAPSAIPIRCAADDVDGLQPAYDPAAGLCHASDDAPSGERYNGGDFAFGTMSSPAIAQAATFDQLVGSWDAVTPAGTWIELHARVLQAPGWSGWYALPVWTSDAATLERHSVAGQKDARGRVDTDTLVAAEGLPASAYQLAVTLFSASPDASPAVRLVRAATVPRTRMVGADDSARGADLPVPQRSQMLPEYRGLGFGGGGEAWCSPTTTSMIMAYWGNMLHLPQLVLPVPAVAAGTYDYTYRGAGNWPFNTAFAGTYGLVSYVERFASLDELEPWIKASVPVAISIAFRPGELSGAPIPSSPGHLLVVRGFTPAGDVIVNDPVASSDTQVRMVYRRSQLERVWQRGSHGTAYLMYPPGWQVPTAG
jgi:hypothetical protein